MRDERDDSDRLKPCPFCGGEAEFGEIADVHDPNYGGLFISCLKCDASTNLRFACGEDPRPLLMEGWNRRVPSTVVLTALAHEVLAMNAAWNAKEPITNRLDLCRRLALEILGAKP